MKKIAIGIQDYEKLRQRDALYIDKTDFIREWWDSGDDVTLITRPRRFGKTLNMSMLNCFFSNKYAGRGDLFEGLSIWKDERFRKLQGTYPVLFLSFAGVKQRTFEETKSSINQIIADLYNSHARMLEEEIFTDADRDFFYKVNAGMENTVAAIAVRKLCEWFCQYYNKKVLILLDEYDTPMQEAYVYGFWDELAAYIRALFNNTFKTNNAMERAVLTGITRVSKQSVFSDLNNLVVVTTTSGQYATAFGFTEEEVFRAMDDQGCSTDEKASVKKWYDGFVFGDVSDIYNPWSVISYLKERKLDSYWSNTSGNGLISYLLRYGPADIKIQFEELLKGGSIDEQIDEQIIYSLLDEDPDAIWSLLLASGYLKVTRVRDRGEEGDPVYTLSITNLETRKMFSGLIKGWFKRGGGLSRFTQALLLGDVRSLNRYINEIVLDTISYFDTGKAPSSKMPENFYHGLVLGLIVENVSNYIVKSNRESGYGRYDVVLEPLDRRDPAVIIEFKVYDEEDGEEGLDDTAINALGQIEEMKYEAGLQSLGIPSENIHKYAFAFRGKECLIRRG